MYSTGSYSPYSSSGIPVNYTSDIQTLLLKKKDGQLKKPKSVSFRKDMMEYFSDCPQLSEKIDNKEFEKLDVLSMATFYNQHCQN